MEIAAQAEPIMRSDQGSELGSPGSSISRTTPAPDASKTTAAGPGELVQQLVNLPMAADPREAVADLEAALAMVKSNVEQQLHSLEEDTYQLEHLYEELKGAVLKAEVTTECHEGMRSLLVCYFPREANKDMIRQAFLPYGAIDSVYLVHKEGKPACYGFVNFNDHQCAAAALAAANEEEIVLIDKRETVWHVKAEWTTTTQIPKKPKKKRNKGSREAKVANKENGFVNGVDGYQIPMPESGRAVQCGPLSYSVNEAGAGQWGSPSKEPLAAGNGGFPCGSADGGIRLDAFVATVHS
jgi:hypothetical protein